LHEIQILMIFKKVQKIIFVLCVAMFTVGLKIGTSAKIEVSIERTYEVTVDNRMLVNEIQTIRNNSEDLWIPGEENVSFQILGFRVEDAGEKANLEAALKSAIISSETVKKLSFTSEILENQIVLKIPYGTDLLPNEQRKFTLNYEHPGLIFKNGAVRDGYIHAFSPSFQFESPTTVFTFNTTLVHSKYMPPVNFVVPEPDSVREEGNKIFYKFSQQSLIDQFVWIQFGVEQNYQFKISQKIGSTDSNPTGFINRYEMILPRDILGPVVNQKVYFESITPEPIGIYSDDLGNIIGVFEFNSHEEFEVVINGFAVVSIDNAINLGELVGDIQDIPESTLRKNTTPSTYWEVDAPDIRKQAEKIAPTEKNVFAITDEMYKFVVDTIDYSTVKRFGLNERQGALATLNGGAAVCMEYSDLFLTLMRARGIPTRAIFGYGYDPRVDSAEQEPHQWVQVYMPGVDSWVDVDVTWGESGDKLIGGDLNHFYTHVATVDPNTPPAFSRFGYSSRGELFPPVFEIQTIEAIPTDLRLLSTPDGLLGRFRYVKDSEFQFLLKQLGNSYVLGVQSLQNGFDFTNKTQLTVIGTSLVVASLIFLSVQVVLSARKLKRNNRDSSIKLKSFRMS
jgi:hypothetical protein